MQHDDKPGDANPDLTAQEMDELRPAVIKLLREAGAKYPCLDEPEFLNQVDRLFAMARRVVPSAVAELALPTRAEIDAYRDLFRRELDKNMHNSSSSPSTDAHRVALHAFVDARNRGMRSAK